MPFCCVLDFFFGIIIYKCLSFPTKFNDKSLWRKLITNIHKILTNTTKNSDSSFNNIYNILNHTMRLPTKSWGRPHETKKIYIVHSRSFYKCSYHPYLKHLYLIILYTLPISTIQHVCSGPSTQWLSRLWITSLASEWWEREKWSWSCKIKNLGITLSDICSTIL